MQLSLCNTLVKAAHSLVARQPQMQISNLADPGNDVTYLATTCHANSKITNMPKPATCHVNSCTRVKPKPIHVCILLL